MAQYLIQNGPMQTTAAFAAVTTGTSIKTMLQVKAGATNMLKIKRWGVSFDGSSSATPIKVELIETDVAATVTASVAADLTKLDASALSAGDPTTSNISVGTSSTGYTSSGEGSITSVRNLGGTQFVAPTNQFEEIFTLGEEPIVQVAKFLRIRVTAGAAVNMYCFVVVEV